MRRLLAVGAAAATLGVLWTASRDDPPAATKSPSARRVVGYINHQRSVYGLRPLRSAPVLSRAARRWSLTLARTGAFKHAPLPNGWRWVAETLYRGSTGPVRAWLESPPHRAILLAPRASLVGVARTGDVWVARFADR